MGNGKRRDYRDFSLEDVYLSLTRWVCCRNLSRVFFFFYLFSLLTILWVMRVYIVWVKEIKVTLKNIQVETFAGHFRLGLSHEVTHEIQPGT